MALTARRNMSFEHAKLLSQEYPGWYSWVPNPRGEGLLQFVRERRRWDSKVLWRKRTVWAWPTSISMREFGPRWKNRLEEGISSSRKNVSWGGNPDMKKHPDEEIKTSRIRAQRESLLLRARAPLGKRGLWSLDTFEGIPDIKGEVASRRESGSRRSNGKGGKNQDLEVMGFLRRESGLQEASQGRNQDLGNRRSSRKNAQPRRQLEEESWTSRVWNEHLEKVSQLPQGRMWDEHLEERSQLARQYEGNTKGSVS